MEEKLFSFKLSTMNSTILPVSFVPAWSLASWLQNIFKRIERFRLRTHLSLVENELRQRNVDQLSPMLQSERTKNIDRLHEYIMRGVFPENNLFRYKRVPFFKDQRGTPCAMAYLIEQSGRGDLVAGVASTTNNVFINDITGGPVLQWIAQSGLTQAEAARVQPTYAFEHPEIVPVKDSFRVGIIIAWIVGAVVFVLFEIVMYKVFRKILTAETSRKRIFALMILYRLVAFAVVIGVTWGLLHFLT